uniref:Peptidase S1 domain-containing protein n=1 Tax=Gopherus agassizii TaxID=38772 RepID=A0A452IGU8_9SAUR
FPKGHRIIGGRNCLFGSRPYQVALLRNDRIYCGGSLIAPKWVLTAAHCKQIRRIHNFFMHPGYNLRPRDNDFMLLELDKPARLNSYVNTINLATCCPSPGTRCSVSGWGTIKSPQRQFPAIMQCADLYSISQARCQASYSGRITENMLCAGVEQGGIGTCQEVVLTPPLLPMALPMAPPSSAPFPSPRSHSAHSPDPLRPSPHDPTPFCQQP